MSDRPTFFFSHARQDRETPGKYLRCFFEDLEIKLAQWAGVNLADEKLGAIDLRISQGDNWDASLSGRLESDKAFVAILTPLYFNRPNCGKELGAFLLRSPNLGIDSNGALTGVQNLLPIRWLPEKAYAANTVKDALIPPILRLVEDTPADDDRDPDRTKAIERYRRKGMDACVTSQPEYNELLNMFVERLRDLPPLRRSSNVSFSTAVDAFNYDWQNYFAGNGAMVTPSLPTAAVQTMPPVPFASVVVFYLTQRSFTRDSTSVDFADQLIGEPLPDQLPSGDPMLNALLSDVRAAALAEGFSVFHAEAPRGPLLTSKLLDNLIKLSESRILTALIIDSAAQGKTWPDSEVEAIRDVLNAKQQWNGPVFLFQENHRWFGIEQMLGESSLSARLVTLPQESDKRKSLLQRSFINSRGSLLRLGADLRQDANKVPMLKVGDKERD